MILFLFLVLFSISCPQLGAFSSRKSNFGLKLRLGGKSLLNASTIDGRKCEGVLRPLGNFILVKKADVQSKTDSGILLSKKSSIIKTEGIVISAGSGKPHRETGIMYPIPVVPGDGVIFGKYDGTEVELDGSTHTLIRDDDVLVKFSQNRLTLDTVEAVNDNVMIAVEEDLGVTSGGLFLASSKSEDGSEKPSTGEIVKVGPGRMDMNGERMEMCGLIAGDKVKFRDYAGSEVEVEGKEYAVVKVADVLAKF